MLNGAYIREPDTWAPIIYQTATHYPRIINSRDVYNFRLSTSVSVDRDNNGISRSALRLVSFTFILTHVRRFEKKLNSSM